MTQKIKDALGIVIIISLLVFSLSTVSVVKTYSRVSEPTSFRSFTVQGVGKAVAIPDIAQFSFGVITEGSTDVAKLQKNNTEKMNLAINFLKKNGVEDEDIKTVSYSVQPQYTYNRCESGSCPPPEITGYSIRQSVSVKVREFETAGNILSGIVDYGVNTVSGLSFTIDDRTDIENEARKEAIGKAKDKAVAIAKAGGFHLGRLLSISEGTSPVPRPVYALGTGFAGVAKEDTVSAPSVEPGSEDIEITVELTYEIK